MAHRQRVYGRTTTRWRLDPSVDVVSYVPPLHIMSRKTRINGTADLGNHNVHYLPNDTTARLGHGFVGPGRSCSIYCRTMTAAAATMMVALSLSLAVRIDLTRRVDDSDTVARAKRKWSAAGCSGRHRRYGEHSTVTNTTEQQLSGNAYPEHTHTSTTVDEHPVFTDLRSTAVRNKLMGYCQNESLI